MKHEELNSGDKIDVRVEGRWYALTFMETVEIKEGLPSIFGKTNAGLHVFYERVEKIRLHQESAVAA